MISNPSQRRSSGDPIVALLLVVAWFVTDHYLPWTGFHSELPAVLAGALAVAGVLRWHARFTLPVPVLVLLGCALVPWAQWAGGLVTYSGDALLASLYLGGTALCFWAGHAGAADERDRLLNALAAAILAASILMVGILLYQWLGLTGMNQILVAEGLPGQRAGANLGQPNHAATLLCMGLAAVLLARTQGVVGNAVTASTAAYLALGLALTQSRVPWLALVVLAAWLLLRRRALLEPLRLAPAAVFGWLAWYTLLFWAANVLPDLIFGGGTLEADASRLAAGRRPVLWGQWLEALRVAPWHGYGWGQGRMAQFAAAVQRPGIEASDYAHNLALDLLAWNGLLPGGLLLLAALAWYLRVGARADGPQQGFRLAAVTLLAVHSMVEYPFAYAYFLVPVALLAGQLDAGGSGPMPTRRAVPRAVVLVLTLAALAAFVAIVRDYLRVEADIRALREQVARIGGVRRTAPVDDLWVLDQMGAFSRASRIEPAPGMPPAQFDDLLAAARRFPNNWLTQQSALALALNGRPEEAGVRMQVMCALHGEAFYNIAVGRLAELARERLPAAQPFVDSLARPAAPAASMPHNRRPACLQG